MSAALGEVNWREIAEHHVASAWDNIGDEFKEEPSMCSPDDSHTLLRDGGAA